MSTPQVTILRHPLPPEFSNLKGKERRKKRKERRAEKKREKRAHKIEKKQSKARYLRSTGKRDEKQAKGEATVLLAQQGIVSPHLAEASGKEKFMKGLTSTLGTVFGGGQPEPSPEAYDSGIDYAESETYDPPAPANFPEYSDPMMPVGFEHPAQFNEQQTMDQMRLTADAAAASANPLTESFMKKNKTYIIIGGVIAAVVVLYLVMKKKK